MIDILLSVSGAVFMLIIGCAMGYKLGRGTDPNEVLMNLLSLFTCSVPDSKVSTYGWNIMNLVALWVIHYCFHTPVYASMVLIIMVVSHVFQYALVRVKGCSRKDMSDVFPWIMDDVTK